MIPVAKITPERSSVFIKCQHSIPRFFSISYYYTHAHGHAQTSYSETSEVWLRAYLTVSSCGLNQTQVSDYPDWDYSWTEVWKRWILCSYSPCLLCLLHVLMFIHNRMDLLPDVWRQEYWLPPGVTWRDVEQLADPDRPRPLDLLAALPLALGFVALRYVFERCNTYDLFVLWRCNVMCLGHCLLYRKGHCLFSAKQCVTISTFSLPSWNTTYILLLENNWKS